MKSLFVEIREFSLMCWNFSILDDIKVTKDYLCSNVKNNFKFLANEFFKNFCSSLKKEVKSKK